MTAKNHLPFEKFFFLVVILYKVSGCYQQINNTVTEL